MLTATPLALDAVPDPQREALVLPEPGGLTVANGCVITHMGMGRVFDPTSDWFSLLEWQPVGDLGVTLHAPRAPSEYLLELTFGDEIAGSGTSGSQAIFVSGTTRPPAGAIDCADIAARIPVE